MRIPAVIILLGVATSYGAIDLANLAENSPFGAGVTSTGTTTENSGLELRGMYVDQGKTYFSIYNAATKQSTWVLQGEAPSKATEGFSVKSFDSVNSVATVDAGGKSVQVSLKQASVSKYEAPPQAQPVVAAGGEPMPPAGAGQGQVQTPWGNFTPEQIAAYRAEREKRWAERMQQQGGKDGEVPTDPAAGGRERGGRDRGGRGSDPSAAATGGGKGAVPGGTGGGRSR
ncbi:MAG TPA: hypothetical protein DCY41_05825 [Opitutae bacterium]|nr:hypothetical protein [Opitutae bacterium]